MIRLHYLPIAILTLAPAAAFAHKVPYGASHCSNSEEQADFEQIPLCTQEEKEKGSAMAFCVFTGRSDLENCAESLVSSGMAEHAGKCVDEARQKQADLRDQLIGHKKGGTPPSSTDGYWHTDYFYSKEDGWHRHDWSDAAREKAGVEYASYRINEEKKSSAIIKTTSETTTTTGAFGKFIAGIGLKGVANVDHEVGVDHTRSNGTTTEKGPLTEKEIRQIYNDAFEKGKADPNLSSVNPNILCEKNKPICSTSFSRSYPNQDHPSQAKKAEDDARASGGSKSGSSSGSPKKDEGSSAPKPSSSSTDRTDRTGEISHTPAGRFAGDPSPVTKPGEMLASYDPDNLDSPVSRCLFESFKEEISKDIHTSYSPDGANPSPEERRRQAEELLKKGICDAKVFGSLYCQKHKTMSLTGRQMQEPMAEKSALFEEMKDMGKLKFGNPADYEDRTPIDFKRLPIMSPDSPSNEPIVMPGRRK